MAQKAGLLQKSNTITLSSGVVLELRRVGYFIANAATRRLKRPKVPVQYIEDKGREEENPAHPDYIAALEEYEAERTSLIFNSYLYFGTKVTSKPADMPDPEDPWDTEFAFLGIEIPQDKQSRYVEWLKLVACSGIEDEIVNLIRRIRGESSVEEDDVAAAAESFPGKS